MITKLARIAATSLVIYCLAGSITSCRNKTSIDAINQETLADLFTSLYLGEHGLNYPSSQQALQSCKATNNMACVKVYERVKIASQEIRSLKSEKALSETFEIIKNSCGSTDETERNFVCHGALMSFYFYAEAEYDAEILNFVKSLPRPIQSEIMNSDLAWFHNRPAPQLWIEYIDRAAIEWQFEGSKEQTKAMFSNNDITPLWVEK